MIYQSWTQRMLERHGDDVDAVTEACRYPDLRELLEHQREQYIAAIEAGPVDYRWQSLAKRIAVAEVALESGDTVAASRAFFALGQAVEALEHLPKDEARELAALALKGAQSEMAEYKRQAPNQRKALFIREAQLMAAVHWAEDTDHVVRLADMCELVYKAMMPLAHELGEGYLPGESEGLKTWLRRTAPEYARKGGRPTKKKL